jgi:two-component system response regulator MprA
VGPGSTLRGRLDVLGHCHRVLIVDDDPAVREAMRTALQVEGLAALVAADGGEALTQLRGGIEPCLILLDLRMPGMNGWAFRDAQLQDPGLARVPVAVFSSGGVIDEVERLAAADCLSKPVEVERVLDAVHRACQLRGDTAAPPSS